MALLLRCDSLSKTYDHRTLFDGVSLTFHDRERVGLIGPNGAGKTTLLKILAGLERADAGLVEKAKNARVAYLAQEDAFASGATVESVLRDALRDEPVAERERLTRVRALLGKLGFEDPSQKVDTLSGGWRKRVAIGRELVVEPDILLMDEPTNHLDLGGILWLEGFLGRATFAFVLVSHDRYFLEMVATRVVELNPLYPDGFYSAKGRYSDFLEKREAQFAAQERREQSLATQVRREIEWLRSGVMARGTKAVGRIRSAERKIGDLDDVRKRLAHDSTMAIEFNATGRRSKNLIEAQHISKTLGGEPLFRDVDLLLGPGSRLGIVGNNGTGKTTLLRVLAGELEPDEGRVKRAPWLRVAVFDQARERLDKNVSLRRALSPTGDMLTFRGRETHVVTWAKRFLFRPEQLDGPVGDLSGGEQARVMVARMMLQPADALMLDEPTNDLDIPSIEVLENSLAGFPGAIALITHDRHMLDRLCTDVVGLHGNGRCAVYGDVSQWQTAQEDLRRAERRAATAEKEARRSERDGARPSRARLSYHEKRELQELEEEIAEAEREAVQMKSALEDPALQSDHRRMRAHCEELHEAETRLAALYERWERRELRRSGE